MAMDSTALMDSFGRSLLQELQENARLSTAELARRVGLSATATAERMKQMEEVGIVHGYTVEMDREALGLEVLAFIRMTCDGQHYFRLMEFVQTLEEVRECARGTDNLLPVLRAALKDRCSMGEVCGAMRDVFGDYRPSF